jgi:hypothetical protein
MVQWFALALQDLPSCPHRDVMLYVIRAINRHYIPAVLCNRTLQSVRIYRHSDILGAGGGRGDVAGILRVPCIGRKFLQKSCFYQITRRHMVLDLTQR